MNLETDAQKTSPLPMARSTGQPDSSPRPTKLEVYRDPGYAGDYDRRWSGTRGQKRDRRKAAAIRLAWASLVADWSRDRPEGLRTEPRSLLDVPTGTGRFTDLFHELVEGQVLGADLAVAMLLEAQEKHPSGQYCAVDGLHLPFPDDSFDVVVCIRFMHLVRDSEMRRAFLREFARVARVGVIVDYRHGHTFRIWGRHLRHRLGLRKSAPSNPSPKAIRSEIEAAGLRLVAEHRVHFGRYMSDKRLFVTRTE
ncbi:ubiquinone/menaquinone biosynthesis methyltransferase [Planctomycetes bacterium Poly30]|uniref:Ubiquinone/menaquinone biosynthesis methyltransferase n=1 Tax=Saltatorellus ferox TaxID=2528018 RepID=A0A518ESG2_9BACT|nr:ubiquinone/menaquinone biosynthesis methyltransferase [Planctomycetes bacterium Poly30]